ncbi:LAMI_0G02454g1_1 [Lachancea mirantina]|uniref:LAMI_0G02454g1_1 n=1 Tax=Lachancea mirantina TaxID=1230905 RepID=A0A1G4K7X3_9SACH|nr:LAMI_0G02454g1_1 [Lachancea mirantina]
MNFENTRPLSPLTSKWQSIDLNKQRNLFVYIYKVKKLVEKSLGVEYLKNENQAIRLIYKTTGKDWIILKKILPCLDLKQVLKPTHRYGEFCVDTNHVTWRKFEIFRRNGKQQAPGNYSRQLKSCNGNEVANVATNCSCAKIRRPREGPGSTISKLSTESTMRKPTEGLSYSLV